MFQVSSFKFQDVTWEQIYDFFGIRDFIYFISSSQLQEALFPIKLIFIFFAVFFLAAVIYFYINSSYIQYKFLQDLVEFFSWQPLGLAQINKRWRKIMKEVEGGGEKEYKLAILQADDFLYKILEDKGYQGETFEELIKSAGRQIAPSPAEILAAHNIRSSIVYDSEYKLDLPTAKRILDNYEKAVKNL